MFAFVIFVCCFIMLDQDYKQHSNFTVLHFLLTLVSSSEYVFKCVFHTVVDSSDSKSSPCSYKWLRGTTHSFGSTQLSTGLITLLAGREINEPLGLTEGFLLEAGKSRTEALSASNYHEKKPSLSYVQSIKDSEVKSFNTYYLAQNEIWHAFIGQEEKCVIGHSMSLFSRHEARLFKVVIMTAHTGSLVWEHR